LGSPDAEIIDLDTYLAEHAAVRNAGGGRGYDEGVRIVDCPLCGERRGRGWLQVEGFAAGCWNAGCEAEPRLAGGAVEWVRRLEGLRLRGEAWALLLRRYPRRGRRPPPSSGLESGDWVRLPDGMRTDWGGASVFERRCIAFMDRQWGVSPEGARRWRLGRVLAGRHAHRVVVPIVMGGSPVGFLSRTIRRDLEPRYLNARSGAADDPQAECGRSASGWLFNVDALLPGADVLLVEGAGDAMGYGARGGGWTPIALLGQALTAQKLAILHRTRPRRVVVALDAGPEEDRRAALHAADLRAWGVGEEVLLGRWVGAKDAGAGARLEVLGSGFLNTLQRRMGAR